MHLLFDLTTTQPTGYRGQTTFHGGSEYTKSVFKKLLLDNRSIQVTAFYDSRRPLSEDLSQLVPRLKELISIDNITKLPALIKTRRIDRVFSSEPLDLGTIFLGEVEFVGTLHGLRSIEVLVDRFELIFRHSNKDIGRYWAKKIFNSQILKERKHRLRSLFQISNRWKYFVSSNHTLYTLLLTFPEINPRDIILAYCASPERGVCISSDLLCQLKLKRGGFYLLTSANRWVKNPIRAIIALDRILTSFPHIDKNVVVTGIDDQTVMKRIYRLIRNKNRFTFLGYVSRNDLEIFYRDAFCLIFPTLNEGYGYPPGEAMKYGTPVIGAAVTSITEVYGNSIMYFEPHSIMELEARILQMTLDSECRDWYSKRGLDIYRSLMDAQAEGLNLTVKLVASCDFFQ